MPSLKQAIADKKAQEPALRRNPEIDAKLDKFIGENPKLVEYYNGLSKDDLIRKLMLGKMQKAEYSNGRNEEIRAWVEEHPEIKAKIEERLRNVPEANRIPPVQYAGFQQATENHQFPHNYQSNFSQSGRSTQAHR